MSDMRPAWSRESAVLKLPGAVSLDDLSPDWAFGNADGGGVRVAVIDSGIDADHPMLHSCVNEANSIEFAVGSDGEVHAAEGPHRDVFGHGTACAGIIHALAPAAEITSVKVLGPGLTGKVAAFHAGLAWAVENEFDVINLSLGTRKRDWALAFHEVCDQAYFSGSFIVTAANNVQRVSFPSLYSSVTSVACNTGDDPLRFHFNPDPPTEFLARGIDVEVPWLDHDTTVTTGNSFAAPHIAGLATLIRSKHPDLRPFQVKTVLWATAANVREAGSPDVAGRLSKIFTSDALGTQMRRTAAVSVKR
jgi:subtilisin family serine protease